jgi:hypothetical protein
MQEKTVDERLTVVEAHLLRGHPILRYSSSTSTHDIDVVRDSLSAIGSVRTVLPVDMPWAEQSGCGRVSAMQ